MATRRSPRVSNDPFWALVATSKRLLGPQGCPWDRAQTVSSLLPHLVEEAWELHAAWRQRNRRAFQEELGDVLYTVVFLAHLAEQEGRGTLTGMLSATRRKMVRRHPHVFGALKARTAREAYAHWQAAKRTEAPRRRSTSKQMQPLLAALEDPLLRTPRAAAALQRTLSRLQRETLRIEPPTRTRAKRVITPTRSPHLRSRSPGED